MKEYKYDDLTIGITESFKITITKEMMDKFCAITGDINPMHVDKNYAISKNFPDKLVYGMLTSSFFSTLGGVYLPGKYCLIQSVESKFINPVFIGDNITIKGTVEEKK